jgi:hypothetical protein
MTDDIERLLRRYQPSGPPSSLRDRVLGGATDRRRTWPWAAAAAILLGATLALHGARGRLSATWTDDRAQERALAVEMVTEMFGGDETARSRAEQTVARDEAIERIGAMTAVGTSGSEP